MEVESSCLLCSSSSLPYPRPPPRGDEDHLVFQTILHHLNVEQLVITWWDFDKESLPFCIDCSGEIQRFLEFERKANDIRLTMQMVLEEWRTKIRKASRTGEEGARTRSATTTAATRNKGTSKRFEQFRAQVLGNGNAPRVIGRRRLSEITGLRPPPSAMSSSSLSEDDLSQPDGEDEENSRGSYGSTIDMGLSFGSRNPSPAPPETDEEEEDVEASSRTEFKEETVDNDEPNFSGILGSCPSIPSSFSGNSVLRQLDAAVPVSTKICWKENQANNGGVYFGRVKVGIPSRDDNSWRCLEDGCVFVVPVEKKHPKKAMEYHILRKHYPGGKCHKCGTLVVNRDESKSHLHVCKRGLPPRGKKCRKCHQRFDNLSLLSLHDCPVKSRNISCLPSTSTSTSVSVSKRKFPCDTCNKTLSSKRRLNEHRETHRKSIQERKTEQCEFCGDKFTKTAISQHRREKHGKGTPFQAFACQDCDKVFKLPTRLRRHQKTHKKKPEKKTKIRDR